MKKFTLILLLLSASYNMSFSQTTMHRQQDEFELTQKYFAAKRDKMKLEALQFLKENIDAHFTQTYYWQDSLRNKISFNEMDYPDFNASKIALKELIVKHGLKAISQVIPDKNLITHQMLIHTIDRAFEMWKKPWNKQLSFDDFCDYLLPYKVQDEPLEDWVDSFQRKFSNLSRTTPSDICNSVNSNLKQWFFPHLRLRIE